MADAVKPARQDVKQEPADELVGSERHHLLPGGAVAAIVLVTQGNAIGVKADELTVRDGNAVSVARQIGEHRLGPGEWRRGIYDSALFADRRQVTKEGSPVGERRHAAKEREPPGVLKSKQPGEEQTAEQRTQHPHREEERRPRRYPALATGAMPPPGTIMWTCGWSVIAEPQVWSTAVMPIRAPRCLGSAAMVSIVSEAARNSRS